MKKLALFLTLFLSVCLPALAQIDTFEDFQDYHEQIKSYWLDEQDYMRLNPNDNGVQFDNENPNLFTAEYFFLAKMKGFLKGEIKEEFLDWAHTLVSKIELEQGNYNRRPGFFKRHFSRDEQIGLAVMDFTLDYELGTCMDMREHGTNNAWHFDNRRFGGRTGYNSDGSRSTPMQNFGISFRQPEFIEFIRGCAGRKPKYLGQKAIAVSLGVTGRRDWGKTSGKIMAIMRLEVLRGNSSKTLRKARKKFYKRMTEMYGTRAFLHEIFKIYFKNPHHPAIVLSKGLTFPD